MTNTLRCPSCSAQMNIEYLHPGDKIARCPYCNTVVDLPDGPAETAAPPLNQRPPVQAGANPHYEKTAEVEEEQEGKDFRVKRTVRVSEKRSAHTSADSGSGGDLFADAQALLDGGGFSSKSFSQSTTHTKEVRHETSSFQGSGPSKGDPFDLPDDMSKMIQEMGFDLPSKGSGFSETRTGSTTRTETVQGGSRGGVPAFQQPTTSGTAQTSEDGKQKQSVWKRLFGKK